MRILLAATAILLALAFLGVASSRTVVVNPHPGVDISVDLHAWCEEALRRCWDMDPTSLGMNPVTSALPANNGTLAGAEWEQGRHLGLKLLGQHVIVNAGAEASANVSNSADQSEPPQVPCADPECPDLVGDPVRPLISLVVDYREFTSTSCAVLENVTQPGLRRLMRFGVHAVNVGLGDLEVGDPSQSPQWFEWGACHDHWHFKAFAAYRLWDVEGYAAWQTVKASHPGVESDELLAAYPELAEHFVAGHKQGFCLRDSVPWLSPPAGLLYRRQFTDCETRQGISPYWADEYGRWLDGQWVDVTGLPPGAYVLETEINPEHIYIESDYTNNSNAYVVTL
jgi:hypothetical protein